MAEELRRVDVGVVARRPLLSLEELRPTMTEASQAVAAATDRVEAT